MPALELNAHLPGNSGYFQQSTLDLATFSESLFFLLFSSFSFFFSFLSRKTGGCCTTIIPSALILTLGNKVVSNSGAQFSLATQAATKSHESKSKYTKIVLVLLLVSCFLRFELQRMTRMRFINFYVLSLPLLSSSSSSNTLTRPTIIVNTYIEKLKYTSWAKFPWISNVPTFAIVEYQIITPSHFYSSELIRFHTTGWSSNILQKRDITYQFWGPNVMVCIFLAFAPLNWNDHYSKVLCCFPSTEPVRTIRSPGRPPRLSHKSRVLSYSKIIQPLILYMAQRKHKIQRLLSKRKCPRQ